MTTWDYTALAESYADRPGYAEQAIDAIVAVSGVSPGSRVCDVGAGTGHLTVALAARDLRVDAVEPNNAMRRIGVERTANDPRVAWHAGTGEETGRCAGTYDLVSFGSSFNVVDQPRALLEARRILLPKRWFACLWNHRDLTDPLQARIEELIASYVPGYDLGNRRADQRATLRLSCLFDEPVFVEVIQAWQVDRDRWLNAWFSHATLQRQAGPRFVWVVNAIADLVSECPAVLSIPYITRVYLAAAR